MSDRNSIGGALSDLAKETVKQVVSAPLTIAKGIPGQVVNRDSEEIAAKKKAEKVATFHRIKEIEAEMSQIRTQNQQKEQATTPSYKKTLESIASRGHKKLDEASRQAIGKSEQGRNFKG